MLFLAVTSMVIFSLDTATANARTTQTINVEDFRPGAVKMSEATSKHWTKQQKREDAKLLRHEKRVERKKSKVANLLYKLNTKAAAGDSSGVGLAVIIILIGAALALLGLVGIADLLISIGLIVLAVGLIIWLFTAIASAT